MHPLVKDWIRLRADRSISQENIYVAATLVKKILWKSWQKEHFDLPLLAAQNIPLHIIALEESYQEFFTSQPYIPSNQKIFDEYTTSQSWFARFLLSSGSYHLAAIIYRRLNAQNEKYLGLEHPSTLTSMASLASKYWNQGRWKEAKEPEVQVMGTRKRVLGLEHPDTLISMANLAFTFWSLYLTNEAIQLMSKVVQYRRENIGYDHPDTIHSIHTLHTWQDEH